MVAVAAPVIGFTSTSTTSSTTPAPPTSQASGTGGGFASGQATPSRPARGGAAAGGRAVPATRTSPEGSFGPVGHVNLLTGRAAHFDGSTGGWAGQNARLSWTSAAGTSGHGALVLSPQTFGPRSVTALSAIPAILGGGLPLPTPPSGPPSTSSPTGDPGTGGLAPARPGMLYRGTASVETPGQAEYAQALVVFYDATGRYLTSVAGQETSVTGGWTTLVPTVGLAPPSAASVALGVVAWSQALLGQQTFVTNPSLTQWPAPDSSAVQGPLHVAGNQIVQGDGVPVVLRGVDLFGLESGPPPPGTVDDGVTEAKAWGADMVRVSLGEQYWLPGSCSYSPAYAPDVDQVVNEITSLGMVALLDLHANTILPCTTGGPQMMADEPGSQDFWSSVASRYASDPLVAFDLYNEPHGITDAVWLNGGTVMSGLVPFQAAGMQQLYDTVRGTGAQNLVIVSGNNWGNDLPATRVQGYGVAYGVHDYTCTEDPPPSCATPSPDDPSPILDSWVGPSSSVPVIVSEFGWPSQSDGTFIANVIAFASAHGWGWDAFAFGTTAPFGLVGLNPVGGTFEPSASGVPVLSALAGLSVPAGAPSG